MTPSARNPADLPRIWHLRWLHSVSGQGHGQKVARDHHDDHQHGSQNRMPGHDQADGQQEHLHDLLGHGIERVGQNALKRDPALFYRGDNAAKPGFGQDNTCCRLGHIGCGRDGDADLCLTERGRIVRAITAHPDRMPVLLERFDEVIFSFRKNACEDREIFW
jgi:hypothetical protein